MKILYIESRLKNLVINPDKNEIEKLPKKLFLVYTIQYKSSAEKIKKQLENNNIKIIKTQQVLGCSKINNKEKLPVLLIGTGRFHAINLYLQASAVYIIENNQVIKIPESEIEQLKNKRKTALIKFLKADKIGILVSTKSGQENLNLAVKLKQKLEKKQKQVFIFISNNIDIKQFENFNIDSWINTACPGLSYDNSNIINYEDIIKNNDFL